MISKKEFLDVMKYEDEDLISNLYEKLVLSEKTGKPYYSNEFYPSIVWRKIEELGDKLNILTSVFGAFEEAERRIIIFGEECDIPPNVAIIKIKNGSNFKDLSHKDYLGAMLSLGIGREKFGDFVLQGESCYICVMEDIVPYIEANLNKIGKNPCKISKIKDFNLIPKIKFEERVIIVSSNRVDTIIAALSNLSRGKSEELIRKGLVSINYSVVNEKNTELKEDSIVTIRGIGKFKIISEVGWSAKGKVKILTKKFI